MNRQRIFFLDYVRAVCILYIVGFWHLSGYCNLKINDSILATNIAAGVLGTFTFISAFLLGRKKIRNVSDICSFYKKRLLRIYPLFLLSCLSLYFLHLIDSRISYISSLKQLILTLLGLSCLIPPAPQTVWFISMLILLYVMTPLVSILRSTALRNFLLLLFSAFMIVLGVMGVNIDTRLTYLVPLYCLGLALSKTHLFQKERRTYLFPLLLSLAGFAVFCTLSRFCENRIFYNVFVSLSFTAFLLCAFKILEINIIRLKPVHVVFASVSYASYCLYLFHRQIFGAAELFFKPFPIWGGYCIVLPFAIFTAYCIQKIYDFLIIKKSGEGVPHEHKIR